MPDAEFYANGCRLPEEDRWGDLARADWIAQQQDPAHDQPAFKAVTDVDPALVKTLGPERVDQLVDEIERLRERYGDMSTTAPASFYPDAGLKTQVRPFEETQAMSDVLLAEQEKRNNALDAAQRREEQGRIERLYELDQEAIEIAGAGYIGTLRIGVTDIELEVDMSAPLDGKQTLAMRAGRVQVSGAFVIDFEDPAIMASLFEQARSVQPPQEAPEVPDVPALAREIMWAIHNLIAHPLSEVCHWIGFLIPPVRDFGLWLHDATVPPHAPNTGRG